jgi:protein SCO1/2
MNPLRPLVRSAGCAVLLASALAVAAQEATTLDREQVLRASQAAIGREVPADYRFTDTDGRTVTLGGLRGTPVVISLIYTSCYNVCPMVTEYLAEVVAMARKVLGQDSFRVLTIGFDAANDNPVRMRQFALERDIDDPAWRFLSGDPATIAGLARDLGFSWVASVKGFDHMTQATVLDREGRIYRQVYGDRFPPTALVEPLKELVFSTPPRAGLVESLTNEVRLFCTVFDPKTGRYRFDYSIFVEIFVAVTCLTAAAYVMIRTWRQAR